MVSIAKELGKCELKETCRIKHTPADCLEKIYDSVIREASVIIRATENPHRYRDSGATTGILPIGVASPSFDTTAFTIDLGVRWQTSICGLTTTPSISFKYISDMATIMHSETLSTRGYTNVGVRSEEAYFLSLDLEFLL